MTATETGQRRLDLIDWTNICRACNIEPEAEIVRLLKKISPLVPKKRLGR